MQGEELLVLLDGGVRAGVVLVDGVLLGLRDAGRLDRGDPDRLDQPDVVRGGRHAGADQPDECQRGRAVGAGGLVQVDGAALGLGEQRIAGRGQAVPIRIRHREHRPEHAVGSR